MDRVAKAIVQQKTCVIDLDLRAYFDTVRHHLLLDKVALRVRDDDVMHLLRLILKASGKQGVPQGGVISPLLSNIYLTEVDRMLERAQTVTTNGEYTAVEYARFSHEVIIKLIANTTTQTGLRIRAALDTHHYPTGVSVSDAELAALNLKRADFHGEWNYTLLPSRPKT